MTQRPQPEDATAGPADGDGHPPDGDRWAAWTDDLVAAVRTLPDRASLTLTAPESAARPVRVRPARLGGLLPARHRTAAPWVRLTRAEDHLRGFCIGPGRDGGGFPYAPHERAALADLGWRDPAAFEGDDLTRWWPDDVTTGPFLPQDEALRAARMVAATFRTVLTPPSEDDLSPQLPRVTAD